MKSRNLLLGLVLIPFTIFSQQLEVVSVFPPQNDNTASADTEIRVDFNMPIDTAGIAERFVVMGSMNCIYPFTFSIDPSLQTISLQPDNNFLIGERIEVIVRNSLSGAGGESFLGFNWSFKIGATLATPPYFEPPVIYSQYLGTYLITADVNDDDAIDIILANPTIITYILVNDGLGNFSLYQSLPGAFSDNIWLVDADLDGRRDLALFPYFYEQAADGFFYYDSVLQLARWDVNRDGFSDLIFVMDSSFSDSLDYIGIRYNDGTGHLSEDVDTLLVDTHIGDLAIGDFNNDGIIDIAYFTTIFAIPGGVGGRNSLNVIYMSSGGDTLYRNIYNSDSFPYSALGMPFRFLPSDFNNDGFLDIFLQTNDDDYVIFNDTQGGFETMTAQSPVGGDLYHWGIIGDISGDGWLDLVYDFDISIVEDAGTFYLKNENGQFSNKITIFQQNTGPIFSSGIADFDSDGAQDIATCWFDGLYIHFNRDVQNVDTPSGTMPEQFRLFQNYPNPFNGETLARFYLPKSSILQSAVYDITGKEVKKFSEKLYPAGENRLKWDAKNNTGKEVSSGIYIWKFKTQGIEKSIKLMLIR